MPEVDSSVEYRDIPGFKDYRIGTDGSVWSKRKMNFSAFSEYQPWKRIKVAMSRGKNAKQGYPHFNIYREGKRHTGHVHVLVLLTFRGPKPDGHIARHLDGDPTNNHLDNLAWGTPKENSDDKYIHGTVQFGEQHHSAVLTKEDVIKARRMKLSGMRHWQIAEQLSKGVGALKHAIRGANWSHIDEVPAVICNTKGAIVSRR